MENPMTRFHVFFKGGGGGGGSKDSRGRECPPHPHRKIIHVGVNMWVRSLRPLYND